MVYFRAYEIVLRRGELGGLGVQGGWGIKEENWENYNSIINKIYCFLKEKEKTHVTPYHENKQSNLKMGKGPEQTLLQGGHTEGPETYERILNITSHQRDAN